MSLTAMHRVPLATRLWDFPQQTQTSSTPSSVDTPPLTSATRRGGLVRFKT